MLNYSKYFNSLISSLLPPERMTIDQWADKYRQVDKSASPYGGKWSTDRTPYMRFIMQQVTNPKVEQITLKLPSQVGKTELINNISGYFIHNDPCTIMFLLPTMALAEAFSKEKISKVIKATPVLKKIIDIDKKSSENTVTYKEFEGGYLVFVGSQTAKDLASRPIRILLGDEIDRYSMDADGEGCPLELAKKRTTNFWNRKWILNSTPTEESTSKIEKEWELSSKHRYYVPCQHCGHKQYLKFAQVKWVNKDPETASYLCEECGVFWDDTDRLKAIDKGEWIADNPQITKNLGFHIPRFSSTFCKKLSTVVQEWLDAQGNSKKLKVFVNTVLAETWKDSVDSLDKEALMSRREEYPESGLPHGVLLLTAGVDVQKDRLECMIVGWGENSEAWIIDHKVIFGSPLDGKTWRDLYDFLGKKYYSFEFKDDMKVNSVAIDSGNWASAVYNACYTFNDLFDGITTEEKARYADIIRSIDFYATKGASEKNAGKNSKPIVDFKQVVKAHELRMNLKPFSVGTYEAKTMLVSMLKNDVVGGGCWHFHNELQENFFEQLTSEELRMKFVNGRDVFGWHKKNESIRNEVFDTAVLNLWTYLALNKNMRSLRENMLAMMQKREEEVKTEKEKEKKTFKPLGRRN